MQAGGHVRRRDEDAVGLALASEHGLGVRVKHTGAVPAIADNRLVLRRHIFAWEFGDRIGCGGAVEDKAGSAKGVQTDSLRVGPQCIGADMLGMQRLTDRESVSFASSRSARRGTVAKALLVLIPAVAIVAGWATSRSTGDGEAGAGELARALWCRTRAEPERTRVAVQAYFDEGNFEAADTILSSALRQAEQSGPPETQR